MKYKIILMVAMATGFNSLSAMLPAKPKQVPLPAYDDSQDVVVNNELQCLQCYTTNGIAMFRKSKKLRNEPLEMVARQELDKQQKQCLEFKDETLFRQKARRNAMKQIAHINRALEGKRYASISVNLFGELEND